LNTHQVADRAFNKLIDDTYLASLRHAEMPENKRVNFSFKVQAPFLITPPGYTSVPSNMSVNVEAFNALVKNIMQIADQVAGAYTPSSANPYELASKSATQSAIDAQKDAEVKEGVMSRFLNQWNAIISTIIRRILDKGTYDEQAKAFQEELKELGVTEEMMEELRGQDPFEGLADYSSTTRNSKIISFYTTLGKGNPAFDQMRMLRDVTAAMVDNEYANEVLFPTGDPSVNDVAINQQMTEFGSMIGSATPIKPSPADDDIAHLQTSMKMIMAYTQQNPMLDKEHLMGVKMNLMHMGMHIQAAEVKGAKPKELKEFERFVDMMVEKVKQYEDTVVRAGQAGVGKLPTSNGGEVAPEPDPTEANSAGGVIGAAPVGAA
jgi:hypothetical protein